MLDAGARRLYPAHGLAFSADELRDEMVRREMGETGMTPVGWALLASLALALALVGRRIVAKRS